MLKGAEGEVADNIRAYLSLDDEPCDAPLWRIRGRFKKAEQEIRKALQAFGYYRPTIQSALEQATDGACWQARFTIEAGERVKVRRLEVAIEGEACRDPAFGRALKAHELKVGQPLRQDRYEGRKRAISNLTLSRGYFEWALHRLRAACGSRCGPCGYPAALRLGPPLPFRAHPDRAGRHPRTPNAPFLSYREGQPYDRQKINKTYRGLIGSGYFRHVLVQPRLDKARDGGCPFGSLPRQASATAIASAFDADPLQHGS
jgi:translocation and assembly module TamA